MNNPLKISNIVGQSRLSHLFARLRVLAHLEQELEPLLPASLRPHSRVLAVNGRTLVLAADAPAWAARLRFQAPQLLRGLARVANLDSIKVRVCPPQTEVTSRSHPSPVPCSRQSAATLRQTALTVSDPELKSALLRLARNGRDPGGH